ncbi:Sedlin [Neolentinus lepideus HHB14362 ss-1]|uniref:Trafficking protein particle complex subunit 2-like protein n=1 Tax=Neolentinus lepideus HHB14362 ss-1 TaxID=1314782 RepID=A0A165S197_9AGAM|nr:Sedlin [Neolentinus lepideus HHB14362 ss-1]
MPPQLRLNAVAFISPQNHPILIRPFSQSKDEQLKYHYLAHTSLDVFEERVNSGTKATESYLGLLFSMENAAVYGYITPLKMKIVLALALSDVVVRDADITTIFRALHMAYYHSVANPFLKLHTALDTSGDHSALMLAGSPKWESFRRRVDEIGRAAGAQV